MVAALLFLVAAAGVPPALTEAVPALALRWRELPLERAGQRTDSLVAVAPVEVALQTSPVLRLRGAFPAGCEPVATRLFANGSARAELPLPRPRRSQGDFLVVLPPALAPLPARDDQPAPVLVGLSLPRNCAPLAVRAFEADEDDDPYAGELVPEELERVLDGDPDAGDLARWLQAVHPRLWQEQAALALALPRLLGGAPGSRALAAGLLALATAELRTSEIAFSVRSDLGAGPTRRLGGSQGAWSAIAAGGQIELDVRGEEVVRLAHRAAVEARTGAPLSWRTEATFDDDPPIWLLAHAPVDPAAPEASRARSRVLPVPPGARRLRLRAADGPVLAWAEGAHAKRALHELFRPGAAQRLEEARRAGGPASQLAAAVLGKDAPPLMAAAPVPAALLAVLRAGRARDPDEAASWLRRASEHLQKARAPLDRAAAGLVEAMAVRVAVGQALQAGRLAEAAARLLELAARRPLCDEDAIALLEADAFARESLSGSPQALLVADGLLARRPLDPALALARQRAFAGAARWQELSNDPGPREVHFLDPLADDGAIAAPEHSRFVPVPRGGREVELPAAPLSGHLPLLGVVTLRPPGAPPVVRVNVDGTPFTLPAVGPLERVDLPARPGRHRVELGSAAGATELLVNWAGGSEPGRRWRRYLEVSPQPLELHNRDVGAGDLLSLAVRVVGPPGADPTLSLVLSGDALAPITIAVQPGPLVRGASGDLDAELGASAPVEVVVPVATANPSYRLATGEVPPGVRVLVHLCARRRASVAPLEPGPLEAAAQPAREETAVETVAQLTGRLQRGPRPALYLARAAALAAADEAALAREDLVRALAGSRLEPPARRLALALWRHLDDVGSSSFPETVDGRSSWAHSPAFGFVLAPLPPDLRALGKLADDRASLRRLSPAALAEAAGGAGLGDFAQLAAARQAERDGDWARAAELWHTLAAAHDEAGLLARAAAALLALPPDPLRDVSAYVDLFGATQLDPHDPVAARLLRRAAARTRLRPVHEVDDSAGTVTVAGAASSDPSVEAALLPADARAGELVTADRQLNLSFELAAPLTLRLHARVRELRPAGARAVARAAVALAWSKDGEGVSRAACPTGEGSACRSGPITLGAGSHTLVVRLDGGLRPAAWVAVESAACPAGVPCHRSAVARNSEYLVARGEQPVVVTLFGPAAVEIELRPGPSSVRRQVNLAVHPAGAARPTVRRVSLAASSADHAASETLVLDRDQAYRLEVRPERGEVLCRLSLRDGIGTEAARRPALPATLAAAGPAPFLPPPDLEQALRAEVRDGDVAPGWEDLGTLAAELGWRTSVDVADSAEVVSNGAQLASLTYRRLVERLHLTLKVGGEARFWHTGRPSQAALVHGYFQHPEARWARVLASADAATQMVGNGPAAGADALLMLEPVATLRSGLHLISKLGMRWHWQSLSDLPDEALAFVDPDVFNRYAARHPRALFWEEGLELAPLRDLLFYGGARATSNPALSLRHPDRISAMAVLRSAIARFTLSAGVRWSWFLAGPERSRGFVSRTGSLDLLYTLWVGHTSALTVAVEGGHHLDLHASELALRLGWELSNGRRLRDHTAVEGENYFYPQRGPGREAGWLRVDGP